LLDKCLASVYANIPVNALIVVDGFSTDRTRKIIDEVAKKHGNVTVLKVDGSRARARERGIAKVSTDWFVFVDSDVVLSKEWLAKAEKSVGDNVGAVWGINFDIIPHFRDRRFLRLQGLIARQCFSLRGGTHDALIRRESVEDIRIPEELHTYEDSFIMNWIRRKGYRVVIADEAYCLHYKPPGNWSPQNIVDQSVLELKCGLVYSHNFAYMLFYPVFMFYGFVQFSLQFAGKLVSR
jgi:glycosyltransferase involved in cell wall biosynthesis